MGHSKCSGINSHEHVDWNKLVLDLPDFPQELLPFLIVLLLYFLGELIEFLQNRLDATFDLGNSLLGTLLFRLQHSDSIVEVVVIVTVVVVVVGQHF